MATAPTLNMKVLPAPNGRDEKFITYNATAAACVQVPIYDPTADEPRFDYVDAPIGSAYLYSAPRQCGDWYAEFEGSRRHKAGFGPTQSDAIRNAAQAFAA
ncbi:MAG TPA: hypothetical protein VF637_08740 [Sphingomicrobium sp.]|jgi:hypothetical protein